MIQLFLLAQAAFNLEGCSGFILTNEGKVRRLETAYKKMKFSPETLSQCKRGLSMLGPSHDSELQSDEYVRRRVESFRAQLNVLVADVGIPEVDRTEADLRGELVTAFAPIWDDILHRAPAVLLLQRHLGIELEQYLIF